MNTDTDARPRFMRFVRRFAWPIIIGMATTDRRPERACAADRVGRAKPRGDDVAPRRAGDDRRQAHRRNVPRVGLRQHRDDRPRERSTTRRRGAPLLRRLGEKAAGRPQARAACPERVGRSAHRRRCPEPGRQSRLRPTQSGRQPGQHPGQPVRRRGAEDRRQVSAAQRAQGLRHRSGTADDGHERSRRQKHVQDDGRDGCGHHDHALHRLSFHQHGASGSRHGRFRDGHGQRACRASREQRVCWGFRRSSSPCCPRWRSRREPITRSFSSVATRRLVRPVRIEKPPTTRCSAGPLTSSWARG